MQVEVSWDWGGWGLHIGQSHESHGSSTQRKVFETGKGRPGTRRTVPRTHTTVPQQHIWMPWWCFPSDAVMVLHLNHDREHMPHLHQDAEDHQHRESTGIGSDWVSNLFLLQRVHFLEICPFLSGQINKNTTRPYLPWVHGICCLIFQDSDRQI